MAPGGSAHLTNGFHRFVEGEHLGHPALIPLGGINRNLRDRNFDERPEIGEPIQTGPSGVYVHIGGKSQRIGRYSAGCIAIHDGVEGGHCDRILQLALEHLKKRASIDLLLWRGGEFLDSLQNPESYTHTLRYGDTGHMVTVLQRFLEKHIRFPLAPDGILGPVTLRALQTWQKRAELTPDGICGPITRQAMDRIRKKETRTA